MGSATLPRDQVLNDLKKQRVRIPDWSNLYGNWPNLVNPAQHAVTEVVQHLLTTHSMSAAVETKLKKANLSLLLASWFPLASAKTLKDITYFVCWMYVFDDAVIDKLSWPGHDNAEAFDAANRELLDFVYASLKLNGDLSQPQPRTDTAAIDTFRGIGEELCRRYTLAQRQRFYDACKLTMDGYRTEQRLRLTKRLPTVEEYMNYREGSSCISMCVAMIELQIDAELPAEIIESTELQQLWRETVVLVWLTNDIVSAKKELAEGFVENLVALLSIETGKAQDGIDRTMDLVHASVKRLNEIAKVIDEKFGSLSEAGVNLKKSDNGVKAAPDRSSKTVGEQVKLFVEACQLLVTGSLSWRCVL